MRSPAPGYYDIDFLTGNNQVNMTTTTPTTIGTEPGSMRLGPSAVRAFALGLLLAAGGFGVACMLGFQDAASHRIFFHAYLTAFAYFLSITLGGLYFVLFHHLARAGWSVTVRRLAEGVSGNIGLMLLLFLPVALEVGELYEWASPDFAAGSKFSAGKAAYLSPPMFLARFALYFAVTGLLVWYFRSRSIRQDATRDPALSLRMELAAGPGVIALSFVTLFVAIDLLMSRSPDWTSTIFGVYYFAGCALMGFTAPALLAAWIRRSRRMEAAFTIEHLHDLGKYMFAFVVFWGYIAFSQYLLIWYANLPEETVYYLPRQTGPWIAVSVVLLAVQLVLPLLGLLPRWAKRTPAVLAFWSVWLLAAHLLDMFWLVMPGAGGDPGDAKTIAMVVGLAVGMGGLYLANMARLLGGASLVPTGDPRLQESLDFENE